MLISRKIRAIEIEEGGTVTRYTGEMVEESSWESPFKYKPESVASVLALNEPKCRCGHTKSEHVPECIYKVHGCECEGYVQKAEGIFGNMGPEQVKP